MSAAQRSAASALRHRIISGALPAFAVVAGCAVGPDYRAPELRVPARYSESVVHASPGPSLAEWWRMFHDAPLERLVARAIGANLDLRIAEARVREARALRGVARSALWPTVDGAAAYSRARQSQNGLLGGAARRGLVPLETDLYEAALDASWEIDIFGGTRRAVETAEAEIGAADEARRDVLVTLLGELGSTYIELRGLQQELAVTAANIEGQEQTLALTRDRVRAGLATELDVTRAQAQVATTRAEVPSLTSASKRAVHRLSVLVAVSPGELSGRWLKTRPIPVVPPEVPVGVPSDLLRRRPDIRGAERELAAATARIGVATADLYPRFSLTGTVGLQSISAGDFFKGTDRHESSPSASSGFTLSLQISRDKSVQTIYWFPSWSLGPSRPADTLYREVQVTYSNMLIIRMDHKTMPFDGKRMIYGGFKVVVDL